MQFAAARGAPSDRRRPRSLNLARRAREAGDDRGGHRPTGPSACRGRPPRSPVLRLGAADRPAPGDACRKLRRDRRGGAAGGALRDDVRAAGVRGGRVSRVLARNAFATPDQGAGGGVSSRAQVAVLPPLGRRAPRPGSVTAAVRERPALRLVAFAAFGLYGVLRWASMLHPQPTWRSLGMLTVASAIVAIGVLLEGRARALLVFAAILALLAVFAFSGVPFSWVRHVRIWATADGIGQGLSGLPRTLIPYSGLNPWIREVILLGGGLLLLGSALILAFAARPPTETRRAVSAIPLLTLAVLPSTINRPPGVYIHGLLLFGLLALFVWGERLDQDDGAMVVGVAAIAAAAGMTFAPTLDTHTPWINYQALTSSLAPGASESFD